MNIYLFEKIKVIARNMSLHICIAIYFHHLSPS